MKKIRDFKFKMNTDHFSLCWNNFHSNLSSGFNSLLENEYLVDVTLAAEGQYLKAHKIVLSVCSTYFKDLFYTNPCKHPIVILKDVSYNILKDLLQFMYQGEVSVRQDQLTNFMKVAENLQIKGLTEDTMNSSRNGLNNSNVSNASLGCQKRPKPHKKTLLPNKIPKIYLENNEKYNIENKLGEKVENSHNINLNRISLEPEILVKESNENTEGVLCNLKTEPKENPFDDECLSEHSLEIDMSSMVDTSMGESSSTIGEHSQSGPPGGPISWQSDTKNYIMDRQNSPGGLRFLKTPKGRTVVIENGHMYSYSHQRGSKTTWTCVMQRKLNCPGLVTTNSNTEQPILLSYSGHNHSQLNDIISRLDCNVASSSPVNIPPTDNESTRR